MVIEWSETAYHLSYYMRRTQFSGFREDISYQVLKRGLAGWEKQQKGKRDRELVRGREICLRHKHIGRRGKVIGICPGVIVKQCCLRMLRPSLL